MSTDLQEILIFDEETLSRMVSTRPRNVLSGLFQETVFYFSGQNESFGIYVFKTPVVGILVKLL